MQKDRESRHYHVDLLDVSYDRAHPMTDAIRLRYKIDNSVYMREFITVSMNIYPSLEDWWMEEPDMRDKIAMQFFEYDMIQGVDAAPVRRLVLERPSRYALPVFHDEHDVLKEFKTSFGLQSGSVMILGITQPCLFEEPKKYGVKEKKTVTPPTRPETVPVLTHVKYKNNKGRVTQVTLKAQDNDFIYENSFEILSTGAREQADCALTLLPAESCAYPNGEIVQEETRLKLFDQNKNEAIIFYNDKKLYDFDAFLRDCSAVHYGANLKTVTAIKTQKIPTYEG